LRKERQLDGDCLELNAGAARGIRTPDPIITNDVLYQLSYCGFTKNIKSLEES
jgi:hypothetical protein